MKQLGCRKKDIREIFHWRDFILKVVDKIKVSLKQEERKAPFARRNVCAYSCVG